MIAERCLAATRRGLRGLKSRVGAMGDGPAGHGAASMVLRAVAPLPLWGLPILMLANGAIGFGILAGLAAFALLARARWPDRRWLAGAGCGVFCVSATFGVPHMLYFIDTEACVGQARDLITGDVRSLSDTRLSAADQRWIARAQAYLTLGWPLHSLPAIDSVTLANIVVKAPVIVSEMKWRGPNLPVTGLGLWEAKEAYAALAFDRRRVCRLYHTADHTPRRGDADATARRIVRTTEEALALIVPALQITSQPDAAGELADAYPVQNGRTGRMN